jgi:hypothetical protein
VIDIGAPGGNPSRWAAFPPFTATETSPALSVYTISSPAATAPNVSR